MRALLATSLLLTGCFITEPINQRPSIDIRTGTSNVLHRNDFVTLFADVSDPDHDGVTLRWTVVSCTDATRPDTSCDTTSTNTGTETKFDFQIPPVRRDVDMPVESLLVTLTATDDYGARAHPDQQLVLAVANQPPVVDIEPDSAITHVVEGLDFDIDATKSDPDDGPRHVGALAWEVFTPSQSATYTTTTAIMPSTDQVTSTEVLTVHQPMGTGVWTFKATATDWLGATATDMTTITVDADQPPCIAQWSPIASGGAGAPALPISGPTLFQVPVVHDDLDPYPGEPDDPDKGVATFAWSIKAPGASAFAPLAATGNSVELDSKVYDPEDQIELRVEVSDRKHVAITCDPSLPTCSVTPDTTCIQRQTWKVVVH